LYQTLQTYKNQYPELTSGLSLHKLYNLSSIETFDSCSHVVKLTPEHNEEEIIVETVYDENIAHFEFPDVSIHGDRKIITLCGSTRRALQFFRIANLELTCKGFLVFSIGCDTHDDEQLKTLGLLGGSEQDLSLTHFDKITLSDIVFVLNPLEPRFDNEKFLGFRDYVGSSTGKEIVHARTLKKTLWWMNKHVCHTQCACKGRRG
jgi:hypothetical protein